MENIEAFEKVIGYTFKDKELIKTALTHSSYANENKLPRDNERLEFLGDSVLGFVTAEFLFTEYRTRPEGELNKLRAAVVCERSLFKFGEKISLGDYIYMGKGEENSGGRNRPSIVSDAFLNASLVAATIISERISTSSGSTTSVLMFTERISCLPLTFTSTAPPPEHASNSLSSTSC